MREKRAKLTLSGIFNKYNSDWFVIKIIHESNFNTMLCGSYHDFEKGQILRVFDVNSKMVSDQLFDAEGYYVPNYGVLNRGYASKDVTDSDFNIQISKSEKIFNEQISEKKKLDKKLNMTSRNLLNYKLLKKKFLNEERKKDDR